MSEPAGVSKSKGILYVVATPIGNLEDITLRALRALREVEAIACEDTRQTIKILNKYGIKKRLISYYQGREKQRLPEIMKILRGGKDVALVSDGGTPGISDPGFPLIREAIKEGLRVSPVPGPSALTAALSASGLPTHRALFIGFPPAKREAARKMLNSLKDEEATLVFYLPARKALEFLALASEVLGNRQVVLAREMTKVYEEFVRGTCLELRASLEGRLLKGEVTIITQGI